MFTKFSARYFVCFLIVTMPLVFGAVHPVVLSFYTCLLLLGCGGWLLWGQSRLEFPSRWLWVPCLTILFLFLQSIPLPFALVSFLSPVRAENLLMVKKMAGASIDYCSLGSDPVAAIQQSFFLVGLLLYYVALKRILRQDHKALKLIVYCLISIGAIEAVYGFLQFVRPHLGVLWLPLPGGRAAHGTIIYKNQFASLMNLLWPLSISLCAIFLLQKKNTVFFRQHRSKNIAKTLLRGRTGAVLLFFLACFMVLSVLLSLSRGGILSMLFLIFLLILFLPFPGRAKWFFGGIFVSVLGVYLYIIGIDSVINRFFSLGQSSAIRMELYLKSLPVLWDHWWAGIGLGGFTHLSPLYLKGFPAGIHFYRAHNEYLELLIELGGPFGILFFVWLLAGMMSLIIQIYRAKKYNSMSADAIILAIAALCALVGFLLHGIIDFGWRLPVALFYAVTLSGIINFCLSSSTREASQECE